MMIEGVGFDFADECRCVTVGYVQVVNDRFGIDVFFSPGRVVVDDVNLMARVDVGIDNVGRNEPRPARNRYFHDFCSSRRWRKYSMVLPRPSSNPTFGSQPRILLALAISGWRTCGSSSGSRFEMSEIFESGELNI